MAETHDRGIGHANMERGFEFSRLQDQWMATAYALVVAARLPVRRQSPPERSRAADPLGWAPCRSVGGQPA
jgi:hypothetical protein